MRYRTTLLCSLSAAATLTACAAKKPLTDERLIAESSPSAIVLQVQNHNWADIIIYVVHDGKRSRLTSVTATKASELLIPAKMIGQIGSIQLVARELGGHERFISHSLSVRTGSTIVLTLESDLRRSSVAIW